MNELVMGERPGEWPLVLVVEDDDDNRELIAESIATAHCARVITAPDGIEALRIALRERPALVLLDLALPILDGWEVARRLRNDPLTRDTIILALSGYVSERHRREAFAAGCDYYLAKPFEPNALLKMIDLAARSGARREAATANALRALTHAS